ncbi:MAG: methionyl-tRNA formyltransferase [bacterium]
MEKTSLAFWGSGKFGFEVFKIIEQSRKFHIDCLITQPNRPKDRGYLLLANEFTSYAEKNNYHIFTPIKIDDDFIDLFQERSIEANVVASYGQIIPSKLLDLFKDKFINIHPSILPKYRGASPIANSILNGDSKTGVTIMLMDKGLDTGNIILQKEFPITESITRPELETSLAVLGGKLLIESLPQYLSKQISSNPQPNSSQPATKRISRADGLINWNNSALYIYRQFRAFYSWPGIWTTYHKKMLKLTKIRLSEHGISDLSPGTVWQNQKSQLFIQTGKNSLEIIEIQLEGKKPVSGQEFINGYQNFIGSRLG